MRIKGPIFDMTADPVEIQKILQNENPLCYILNQGLRPSQTRPHGKKWYIMAVMHNGTLKKGVVCGLWKQAPPDWEKIDEKAPSTDIWLSGGDTIEIAEELIEDPLCVTIPEDLSQLQLKMAKNMYEIIEIKLDGIDRHAIACARYDPNLKIEGQVLDQEWRIQ